MIKKSFKEQNAITLVALIITIIVLLILAMVSISLVMNSGIIDKSKTAVDKYSQEEIQEQLKLAYSEWQMSQYTGTPMTAQDIQTKLGQIFGAENVTDVSLANGKLTAKINGTPYEYDTATGKAEEIKPQALSTLTKDNYGDYIDLGQNVVGTSATTDDWRILYNDKNGHVYAILADYLPNSNAAVAAAGFKTDTVNDISGAYNVYSSTSRQNLLDRLENEEAWKTLISTALQNKGAKVRGATTGEILIASYNEKYGTSLAYTSYPYLRTNPSDSSSSIDTLYMPHPGSSDYNGCYGYWLASPGAGGTDYVWAVLCDGFVNRSTFYDTYFGVCPVVSLPSNIQVTKNGNIWTVVQ